MLRLASFYNILEKCLEAQDSLRPPPLLHTRMHQLLPAFYAEADAALVRMSSNGKSSTNDDFRGMSHKSRSTLTTKDWVQGDQIEWVQQTFIILKKFAEILG